MTGPAEANKLLLWISMYHLITKWITSFHHLQFYRKTSHHICIVDITKYECCFCQKPPNLHPSGPSRIARNCFLKRMVEKSVIKSSFAILRVLSDRSHTFCHFIQGNLVLFDTSSIPKDLKFLSADKDSISYKLCLGTGRIVKQLLQNKIEIDR